jgi:hypothetical protein
VRKTFLKASEAKCLWGPACGNRTSETLGADSTISTLAERRPLPHSVQTSRKEPAKPCRHQRLTETPVFSRR